MKKIKYMKLRDKIFYGFGDMGVSITYFSVTFFFMYYLTDIIGLSSLLAGIAYFIGKFWDGINDPIMGYISDKTHSKYGRKRVYMIYGALPFGLSFLLLWTIPLTISTLLQFLLAIVLLFIFGTLYTVITVPYFSMVPLLSTDYDERTSITSIRAMLSILGTIFGGLIALLITSFSNIRSGLITVGSIFGGLAVLAIFAAVYGTRGVENAENRHSIVDGNIQTYLQLFRDRNVFLLMSLKFIGAIATGILSAAIPYFAKYILNNESISTYGLAVYIIFGAISIPVWNKLSKKYDKRKLLLIGNFMVAIVLFSIGFYVNSQRIMAFFIGTALLGISMGSYLMIPYSLVPDLVEYYQVTYGQRHESIFFGLWMSIHQLGISFAGLILGIVLHFAKYDGTKGTQLQSAISAIRISFGVLPGLFLILAALTLIWYSVTKTEYKKLLSAIEA